MKCDSVTGLHIDAIVNRYFELTGDWASTMGLHVELINLVDSYLDSQNQKTQKLIDEVFGIIK